MEQQINNAALLSNFENFLKYERFYASLTIIKYTKAILRFMLFIREENLEEVNLLNAKREDISEFLASLKNKMYSNNTITNYIAGLRIFYVWAAYKFNQQNLFDVNFFLKNIVKAKREETMPFMPTNQEIDRLRETLKFYRELPISSEYQHRKIVAAYAILELLITSGMRSKELRNLRKEDIDMENRTLLIRCGKGGYQRTSLFGESAYGAMEEHLRINNFNAKDLVFRLKHGNALHYLIKRWAKRAKISPRIHAHSFRHYFITASQVKGVPSEIVAIQVGHRNLNSTKHYTHFNTEFIKERYKTVDI